MKKQRILAVILSIAILLVNIPLQKIYGAEVIKYKITSDTVVYDSTNLTIKASYYGDDISFTIVPQGIAVGNVTFTTDDENITVTDAGVVTVTDIGIYDITIAPKSGYTSTYTATACTVEIVELEPQLTFTSGTRCDYDEETGEVQGIGAIPYVVNYVLTDPVNESTIPVALYNLTISEGATANKTEGTISFNKVGDFTYSITSKDKTTPLFEAIEGEVAVKATPIKINGIKNAKNAQYSEEGGINFVFRSGATSYTATLDISPADKYELSYDSGPDPVHFILDSDNLKITYNYNASTSMESKILKIVDISTGESINVPIAFGRVFHETKTFLYDGDTLLEAEVQNIHIDFYTYGILKPNALRIKGEVDESDIEMINVERPYFFETDDSSIISVDEAGYLTLHMNGEANVAATGHAKYDYCWFLGEKILVYVDQRPVVINGGRHVIKENDRIDGKLYIDRNLELWMTGPDGEVINEAYTYELIPQDSTLHLERDEIGYYVSNPDDLVRLEDYVINIEFVSSECRVEDNDVFVQDYSKLGSYVLYVEGVQENTDYNVSTLYDSLDGIYKWSRSNNVLVSIPEESGLGDLYERVGYEEGTPELTISTEGDDRIREHKFYYLDENYDSQSFRLYYGVDSRFPSVSAVSITGVTGKDIKVDSEGICTNDEGVVIKYKVTDENIYQGIIEKLEDDGSFTKVAELTPDEDGFVEFRINSTDDYNGAKLYISGIDKAGNQGYSGDGNGAGIERISLVEAIKNATGANFEISEEVLVMEGNAPTVIINVDEDVDGLNKYVTSNYTYYNLDTTMEIILNDDNSGIDMEKSVVKINGDNKISTFQKINKNEYRLWGCGHNPGHFDI